MPMHEGGKSDVSVANIFTVTVAILFGWRFAVPMAAVSIAIALVAGRRPLDRIAFNVSSYSMSAFMASLPVLLLGHADDVGSGQLTLYILVALVPAAGDEHAARLRRDLVRAGARRTARSRCSASAATGSCS